MAGAPLALFMRIPEKSNSVYAQTRPWSELYSTASFSKPRSLSEAKHRLRRNLTHFRFNYAVLHLSLVMLACFYEPLRFLMILPVVGVILFALRFFRSKPLVVFNGSFGDWVVLAGLHIVTFFGLLLSGVTGTILTAVASGFAIVVFHAALRDADDLFMDEQEAILEGIVSSAGDKS